MEWAWLWYFKAWHNHFYCCPVIMFWKMPLLAQSFLLWPGNKANPIPKFYILWMGWDWEAFVSGIKNLDLWKSSLIAFPQVSFLEMECGSLMPRPYAHACERVWLHQLKFLGSLQNLKATNEIVSSIYWNNEVAKEFMYFHMSQAPSWYYGLVWAVCFQDLLQQLEVLPIP